MLCKLKKQASYKKWRRLYASKTEMKSFPVAFERTHFFLCNSTEFSCPSFCPPLPLGAAALICGRTATPTSLPCLSAQGNRGKQSLLYEHIKTPQNPNKHKNSVTALRLWQWTLSVAIVRILPCRNFWLLWEEDVWFHHFITLRMLTLLKLSKKPHILEKAGLLFHEVILQPEKPMHFTKGYIQKAMGMVAFVVFLYFQREIYPYFHTIDALKFGSRSAIKLKYENKGARSEYLWRKSNHKSNYLRQTVQSLS